MTIGVFLQACYVPKTITVLKAVFLFRVNFPCRVRSVCAVAESSCSKLESSCSKLDYMGKEGERKGAPMRRSPCG